MVYSNKRESMTFSSTNDKDICGKATINFRRYSDFQNHISNKVVLKMSSKSNQLRMM